MGPMRLKELSRDNVLLHSGAPRKERVQYLYGSLNPGLYVVLVGAYVSGLEGNFTCTLLSNYRTNFASFYPPAWMIKKAKREKEKAQISMDEQKDKAAKKTRKFIRDLFGSAAADDADEDSSDDDE